MSNLYSNYYEVARMMASEEQRTRDRKVKIAAMPRVWVRCGRNWDYGGHTHVLGIYWGKKLNAGEGELIYQKWIAVRWSFSFDVSTK